LFVGLAVAVSAVVAPAVRALGRGARRLSVTRIVGVVVPVVLAVILVGALVVAGGSPLAVVRKHVTLYGRAHDWNGKVITVRLVHADFDGLAWKSMKRSQQLRLQADIERVRQVAARYPTVADAMKAGYFPVSLYLPYTGTHFFNGSYYTKFDIDHPSELLYAGLSTTSPIVGVSYYVISGKKPPAAFPGPNSRWHQHLNDCFQGSTQRVIGGPTMAQSECVKRGGVVGSGNVEWMLHVWAVRGRENPRGALAALNPDLTNGL